MKPGNNNRRPRGRGPRKSHGHGMGGPNKGQGYDSGGGEFRVRGNAHQILERYLQLARDAGAAGDRVAAENYLQHADHYYRVLSAMHDGQRPRIAGREVSVADVNVQNVSQGLSAALSTNSAPIGPGSMEPDTREPTTGGHVDGNSQPQRIGNQDFNRTTGPSHHQAESAMPMAHPPIAPETRSIQEVAVGNGNPPAPGRPAVMPPDEQPDYPEELLPPSVETQSPSEAPASSEGTNDQADSARHRPRGRLRGPGRRVRGPAGETAGTDGAEP